MKLRADSCLRYLELTQLPHFALGLPDIDHRARREAAAASLYPCRFTGDILPVTLAFSIVFTPFAADRVRRQIREEFVPQLEVVLVN
jgi:hypothetical protein